MVNSMEKHTDASTRRSRVSVWDLDGTLLRADVFEESIVRLVLGRPWLIGIIAWWFLRGRAFCKGRVARLAEPLWTHWPIRDCAVKHIEAARASGQPILLATAAHRDIADAVAKHVGLFDGVLSSSDDTNLKGAVKLAAIRLWMTEAGYSEFSYAGDSWSDLPIWADANTVVAVSPSKSLEHRLLKLGRPVEVLERRPPLIPSLLRALRPAQWSKNILLFVPMIVGHRFDLRTLLPTCIGFVAFCLTASAVYVLNDLLDLDADRQHPVKQGRPFASGSLTVKTGVGILISLLIVAATLAWTSLPPAFLAILGGYFVANVVYSARLKQTPILDVLMLAGMYALRLEAGGIAGDIPLSQWLLAFSLFFFTSLAFAKRYAELNRIKAGGGGTAAGRGYIVSDREPLGTLGAASGYVAVLVLALYMNSDQMRMLYGENRLLWLICPFVLYWISRIWLFAHRGALNEDPVVFAFQDRVSLAVAAVCGALVAAATVVK